MSTSTFRRLCVRARAPSFPALSTAAHRGAVAEVSSGERAAGAHPSTVPSPHFPAGRAGAGPRSTTWSQAIVSACARPPHGSCPFASPAAALPSGVGGQADGRFVEDIVTSVSASRCGGPSCALRPAPASDPDGRSGSGTHPRSPERSSVCRASPAASRRTALHRDPRPRSRSAAQASAMLTSRSWMTSASLSAFPCTQGRW